MVLDISVEHIRAAPLRHASPQGQAPCLSCTGGPAELGAMPASRNLQAENPRMRPTPWLTTPSRTLAPLTRDRRVDVAVIVAGITGVTTAVLIKALI
jgi:hypothetical protein